MPLAPSAQVAARMGALATNFARAERDAVLRAALLAKQVHVAELRAVTGDQRMSGVGLKGARVGARFIPLGGGAIVQATGPVHLLERPSKPHPIKAGKRRRGGTRARALGVPGHPYASVQHPGVRNPRRPWLRGFVKATPVVTRTIQQQYGSTFARSMRG